MTDWEPKRNTTVLGYIKFKLGGWAKLTSSPEWIHQCIYEFRERYLQKHEKEPCDIETLFDGESLKYKVVFYEISDVEIGIDTFVKKK